MPSISHGRLSELIGMVYDCAIDPDLWPQALTAIRDATRFANATLSAQAVPTGEILLNVSVGIPPDWLASMETYAGDVIELWGGLPAIAAYPLDRPTVLSHSQPGGEYKQVRYYREWGVPQGLSDLLAVPIARDAQAFGTVAMGWHEREGEITAADLELPMLLLPHLQRAVSISRLLDIRTVEVQSFAATLDGLSAGALLVGGDLSIVHANEAARAMLAARDPVSGERGRLAVASEPAQRMLAQAVAAAGRDEREIDRAGLGIPVRRESGPAVLHVLPLRYGAVRPRLAPQAVAAVFVVPAAVPRPVPEQALAALFDLTPAEAKVFALLASGLSVADAARSLGIAQSTVKTHLHQLFQKTGAKRQAELVRLAGALSL
jgi:DNA-binding CsgD family transcriptional regulator